MNMRIIRVLVMVGAMVFFAAACTGPQESEQIVMQFPCDDTEAVIAEQGIELDQENPQEGSACFRIMPEEEKQVIPLFETGDVDAEDTFLVYEAYLKTQDVKEKAYLEMWCVFPERGEFFSRGLDQALSGTTDWTQVKTAFILKQGENPENVRLNLVVEGKGTVWIDGIRLLKSQAR